MTEQNVTIVKNQCYDGTVEGYTDEGYGVVRVNGAVVFVPGAIRGERVAFRVVRVMKTAAVGELTRIITRSPRRRSPDCAYYGKCGGCAFRHMDAQEESWAKNQLLRDALQRLGGTDIEPEQILCAANPLRYRNKIQYPVGADDSPAGFSIGFYQARTHHIIPVSDCLLQPESVGRTAEAVRVWMERYHVPAWDERTGKGLVRHLYVRVNRAGESLCCIVANGRKLPAEAELTGLVCAAVPETTGVVVNVNTRRGNVILGERFRTVWGTPYLMDTLCGLRFRLSAASFFQVNREQAEVLYEKAVSYASLTGNETVLDLYCGIGTVTLCLAKRARRVTGVEIVPAAVRDAEYNAGLNHIDNVEFVCADATEIAERFAAQGVRPDVIVTDPPRKGLTPEGIRAAVSMKPERIVYISCHPGTLGRDIGRFRELGYRTVKAGAVDMFPGTRHVESVLLLRREAGNMNE